MEVFEHVSRMVGTLCNLADDHDAPVIAVGHARPGEPVEVLAPPAWLGGSRSGFERRVLPALRKGLPPGTRTLGISFPADAGGDLLEPCDPGESSGVALCVVGGTPDGVGSVGLYRPRGEATWREAHLALGWLCQELRPLVTTEPLEDDESFTVRIGS